jgi:hypothetical protein
VKLTTLWPSSQCQRAAIVVLAEPRKIHAIFMSTLMHFSIFARAVQES